MVGGIVLESFPGKGLGWNFGGLLGFGFTFRGLEPQCGQRVLGWDGRGEERTMVMDGGR